MATTSNPVAHKSNNQPHEGQAALSHFAVCRMPFCNKKVDARGLCPKHYRRWQKHGDPSRLPITEKREARDAAILRELANVKNSVPVAKKFGITGARVRQIARDHGFVFPRRLPLLIRIYSKCIWNGSCLEWQGAMDQHGYAQYRKDGKTYRVSRLMVEVVKGEKIDGLDVRHSCDNPRCVNPSHLTPGTTLENMRDMVVRDRCGKLTHEQVRYVLGSELTRMELARELGVSWSAIDRIRSGKSWKHITAAPERIERTQ